ncbi:MAG: bifunctional alpha,alpha-trehalose-phosphate synthase (UDP-forming)/trehalose-phosphatase [Planctomycetes bacterium]|nr:bifunctional alpha,alpha-trehalose-phosphate synthase (UDP-forming)/trehalose-phosphatase [Planctomycetota bacterium]
MSRVLIVSNRLPIHVRARGSHVEVHASVGGVATGLASVHATGDALWIGWPGETDELDLDGHAELERELARRRLVGVELPGRLVKGFYEGYANGVLWPLFHSMLESLPLSSDDFELYTEANQRFADAIVAHARPGDRIWIHDYQLLLVPALVRAKLPQARIGFFLHIPFPASPIWRVLPQRAELLRGLLGADLVGFHTHDYARHFAAALLHVLGLEVAVDRVRWHDRSVSIGSFPMGIDARGYSAIAEEPEVRDETERLRTGPEKLLVGIDRLDYTKGIPRRLLALQELLDRHVELRGLVRLVQVAVPSRTTVQVYRAMRQTIDELVGRIQGMFATASWVPVHYLHRALSSREVVALYRAADVMLVTPIRDGMNLVAKEFVAARNDEDGVLVLSEFAGAAGELSGALLVNPFDTRAVSDACHRALTMPREERRERMRAMRARVFAADADQWARGFLATLETASERSDMPPAAPGPVPLEGLALAKKRLVLLDYDGTLVPFDIDPLRAEPDQELRELLARLAALPDTEVHLVSGRPPLELERWLAELDVGLHAEHGLWTRPRGAETWSMARGIELQHRRSIERLLADFAERTPGARVEKKSVGYAWHWRAADPDFGERQANELRLVLQALCSNLPVEVLLGNRVVEVRPHGENKGTLATRLMLAASHDTRILALGDDRTDEDLFAALPRDSVRVHVGPGESLAPWSVPDWRAARGLLAEFAASVERTAGAPVEPPSSR